MGVIYVYHSVCRGQRTTLWESFFSFHLVETGCFCYYEAFIKLADPLVLSSSVVSASHLSEGVLGLHMHCYICFFMWVLEIELRLAVLLPPEPSLLLLRPFEKLSCMKVSTLWFLVLNCKICFILHKIKSRCHVALAGLELTV